MNKFDKYHAISIDNSTLKSLKYNFEKSLLSKLEQFKESQIQVLVPDIILIEIKKHLLIDTINARPKIEEFKGVIEANYFPQLNSALELIKGFSLDEIELLVDDRIKKFIDKTNAIVIESSKYLNVDSLMHLYKYTLIPFENNEKKKREFPDAIALLSLKGYAEENGFKILTVSGDKGWGTYCIDSYELDVRTKLSEAIEILVLQNNQDKFFKNFENSSFDKIFIDALKDSLDQKISYEIGEQYLEVDADSHLSVRDGEVQSISFFSAYYDFIELVEINKDINEFSIKLRGRISFEVQASFNFFVWDSIDREEICLSERVVGNEFEEDFEALINCKFDIKSIDNLKDIEIFVEEFSLDNNEINFGYIEPFDED
jgi:hypothetical protein